jgi:hypothetical protein
MSDKELSMIRSRALRVVIFALVVALFTFMVDRTLLSSHPVEAASEVSHTTYKCVYAPNDIAKIEKLLNSMASDGWEFHSGTGVLVFKK